MKVLETPLPGLLLIEPQKFIDERGYFLEVFQVNRYSQHSISTPFVQDNISRSRQGVLRGLHFQHQRPQGKLVWVTRGTVFDVVVDIRPRTATYGQTFSIELSDENQRQLYIPPGFAHGFCTLSEVADFCYKCTDYYDPISERGICWNDPELNIQWPIKNPILSNKDKAYPTLREVIQQGELR